MKPDLESRAVDSSIGGRRSSRRGIGWEVRRPIMVAAKRDASGGVRLGRAGERLRSLGSCFLRPRDGMGWLLRTSAGSGAAGGGFCLELRSEDRALLARDLCGTAVDPGPKGPSPSPLPSARASSCPMGYRPAERPLRNRPPSDGEVRRLQLLVTPAPAAPAGLPRPARDPAPSRTDRAPRGSGRRERSPRRTASGRRSPEAFSPRRRR